MLEGPAAQPPICTWTHNHLRWGRCTHWCSGRRAYNCPGAGSDSYEPPLLLLTCQEVGDPLTDPVSGWSSQKGSLHMSLGSWDVAVCSVVPCWLHYPLFAHYVNCKVLIRVPVMSRWVYTTLLKACSHWLLWLRVSWGPGWLWSIWSRRGLNTAPLICWRPSSFLIFCLWKSEHKSSSEILRTGRATVGCGLTGMKLIQSGHRFYFLLSHILKAGFTFIWRLRGLWFSLQKERKSGIFPSSQQQSRDVEDLKKKKKSFLWVKHLEFGFWWRRDGKQ